VNRIIISLLIASSVGGFQTHCDVIAQYSWIQKMAQEDMATVADITHYQYTKYTVPGLGIFYLDDLDDIIKNVLKKGEVWEQKEVDVIKKYAKQGTIALDIGAHIGTHTITMAHAVGEKGCVISFEPQKKIYAELVMNLKENGCTNVLPLRRVVGEKAGTVYLAPPLTGNEGGRFIVATKTSDAVEMITLDSLHLHNVSFIKIDVENLEEKVLEGAHATIARNRPIMLIELCGNHIKSSLDRENRVAVRKRIVQKLSDLNYVVSYVSGFDYLVVPKEYVIQ
jgi:FkbM family methyltransferase